MATGGLDPVSAYAKQTGALDHMHDDKQLLWVISSFNGCSCVVSDVAVLISFWCYGFKHAAVVSRNNDDITQHGNQAVRPTHMPNQQISLTHTLGFFSLAQHIHAAHS